MAYDVNQFRQVLRNKGVEIIEFTAGEEDFYRQEWFNRVVPEHKQQKARESHCFDSEDSCGFLWHVFSYDILDCVKGSEAKHAFDSVAKQEAVLLANLGDIASCRLKNLANIKAEYFDILEDVIVTDADFAWTYAKTHEPACGPYFCNK